MDSRRRSAMPPPSEVRSNIPMPSTSKKPSASSSSRLSVAGPALRAPHPAPPSTNPRQSMMRSQNVNPLLQSTSNPSYGRTPVSNNVRRGSTWTGGTAALVPSGGLLMKDTRPLRDRQYQSKMRQDILNYLLSAGFEISMGTLTNIQGKDYRAIFDFLVLSIDPNHELDQSARFEDEFVPALKSLKYPFAHQIDNKWLAAPASMHSWPSLLGVLHWLVDHCKAYNEYLRSNDPTLQNIDDVPVEFNEPHEHKTLAYKYYEDAYTIWLDGVDDFVEPNQWIEDRYSKKNESVQRDFEEKTNRLNQLKVKLNKLKASTSPLAKLQNDKELLSADLEKLQKIVQQYEGRKKRFTDAIAYENAEVTHARTHLEQLKAEQDRLVDIVKTQNLTPEEVIRMNTDHEQLSRNLEDLKQKIADTYKTVMSLEVNVTNRVGAAEEALDAYNNLVVSLQLFPPLPPPWEGVDLTLELNSASSNPHDLLSGPDIRSVVKPTLSSITDSKRVERAQVESERIKVDNELDQLTLECENVDGEITLMEKKVVALNEQADDLRDAAQQDALVANREAERLQRNLAQARTAALASGMGVKSRLQALQFDYREQIEKVARLKEDTIRAIIKNSHEIANFKEEVSRHLGELREFAETDAD